MRLPVEYPHEIPHGICFALARTGAGFHTMPVTMHHAALPQIIIKRKLQYGNCPDTTSQNATSNRSISWQEIDSFITSLSHNLLCPTFIPHCQTLIMVIRFAEYFSSPPIILYIFILYTFAPSVFHLLPRDGTQTGMNDAPRNGKTRMYTTERAIHHTTVTFVKLQGDTTITACYSTEK